jgi:hypothetical protein
MLRDQRTRFVGYLLLAGIVAGLLWWAWVPPRAQAVVVGEHSVLGIKVATLVPFEQEAWIASDGRFTILMLIIGIATAVIAWRVTSLRGPLTVLVISVAGFVSSALAGLIGFLLGGGELTSKLNAQITTTLTVHATGAYFLQSTVFLLIYGLCVAFARDDDLAVGDYTPAPERDGPEISANSTAAIS